MQRMGVTFPEDSNICERHRSTFTRDYRMSAKCQYPGHVASKKKVSVTPMSISAVYQTQFLYQSAAGKCFVPIGSPWCSNCRIRLHPQNLQENEELLKNVCQVCYQAECKNR